MRFQELEQQLGIGQTARRPTWDTRFYIRKDEDGLIRLKNEVVKGTPGVVFTESGYTYNSDDYYITSEAIEAQHG